VLVVHFRLTRRVLPVPPSFGSWLVGSGVMWLAVRPLLPLAVLLALVAPLELLSPSMGLWLALALTLFWLALRGHLLRALVVVGGARHASPELCAIVERAARRQEEKPARPLPRVLVLRWPVVNALAYPSGNILAFTDAAVALLDDDELGAVAAHELGHLAEPTRAQLVRSLQALMWIPLAALRPLHHAFGLPALFGMLAVFALTVGPLRRFSRRMERHADRHAHEDGQDEGLYARTLEKLYRLNAIPAVLPRAQATHPHLYDRLRAAGVEPDYPRPAPPPRWRSLAGMTVAMVLAVLPTVAAWWAPSWLDPAGEDEEQMALASLALGPGGSWELGTLADLRLEEGDSAAAVVLYRAAATLAHQPGLELARLTGALVAAGRCGEAEETYRALDDGRLLVPPEELAAAEASVASCRGAR
jgi:Zn-dependent protease with chaperone function